MTLSPSALQARTSTPIMGAKFGWKSGTWQAKIARHT